MQPVEKTRALDGGRRVEILEPVETGAHISRQGKEVAPARSCSSRGHTIDPAAIAVLAAVGKGRVRVGRRPTVAVLVTGDELVDVWDTPGARPDPQQQRLCGGGAGALGGRHVRSLGVVPDQAERIAAAVREGFASDVLVISGGVSEGAFDLVEEVLARFDVGFLFTKVAIKPGAPLVFGRRGDKLVFGLPGNPVSAQVTFDLFVRAALLRMQGARVVAGPRSRSSCSRRSATAPAAGTTCPRASASKAAGWWPRPCARRARRTSSRTRERTRSCPRRRPARARKRASGWRRSSSATSSSGTASPERRSRTGRRRPRSAPSRRAGAARMVDVSDKPVTAREAVARGRIRIAPAAMRLVRAGGLKGGVTEVARLAGVHGRQAHGGGDPALPSAALTHVDVDLRRAVTASRSRPACARRRAPAPRWRRCTRWRWPP